MYDFHFGDHTHIAAHPEEFLIFCKRMLPRWINGIPDTECIAIYRTLQEMKRPNPVILETGCGASTLALFLYAALNGGQVYSWDTNGSKGSFLRSVISEAMCRPLGVDLYKVWTFIGFSSTSEEVGVPVIAELKLRADFGYFDSWHTLDHLVQEVECFERVASDEFIIALDDAYYTKRHNNYSFVNMMRKKLGLGPVAEPASNKCDPFYVEIERHLEQRHPRVEKIADSYKTSYRDDMFFKYFEGDRIAMGQVGMEEREALEHRYDCWRVSK